MESIWSESCCFKEREQLCGDIQAEIAVIGAGIAGLLTASALQKAGRQVVVLEANRIASGQTRNTTAKITSQHGLIYRRLIDTLGRDKAKQYAMANEAAIEEYRRLISSGHIDCFFEEKNAYVYGSDLEQLQEEVEKVQKNKDFIHAMETMTPREKISLAWYGNADTIQGYKNGLPPEQQAGLDLYDWIQSLMVALVICVALFIFAVRVIDVSGSSMLPTLRTGVFS